MADAVKKLQTRIKLKYDTLANWTSNNPVLLKGEVAFVEVPTGSTEATQPPAIMFKVGDGSKAFKSLSWGSGKAADVYAWAKKKGIEISDSGTGSFIKGLSWDDTNSKLVISRSNVAQSDLSTDLSTKIDAASTKAQNAVNALNGHTVGADVPSDAKFTDTTYALSKSDGTITITPSSGSAQSVTIDSFADPVSFYDTVTLADTEHMSINSPTEIVFRDGSTSLSTLLGQKQDKLTAGTNISISGSTIKVSGASSVTAGIEVPTNDAVINYVKTAISGQSSAYVIQAEDASAGYYNTEFKVDRTSTTSKLTLTASSTLTPHMFILTDSGAVVNLADAKVGDMVLTVPGSGEKAYKDWWIADIETSGTTGDKTLTVICYQLDSDSPILTDYINQMNGSAGDSKGSKDASTKFISYIQKDGNNLVVQEQTMPTTMRNPYPLTIGDTSYDGTSQKSVTITGGAVSKTSASGNTTYTINHATNAFKVKTKSGSTVTEVSSFTQTADKDVTFVAGSNVTLTPNATDGTITIAASKDGDTWRPINFGETSIGDTSTLKFLNTDYITWSCVPGIGVSTATASVNTANFAMTTDSLIIDCGSSSTNLFTE